MNFKTYLEILSAEGLAESPLSDGLLVQATELQGQIDRLSGYERTETINSEIKRLEEKRVGVIWEAIDISRMYPPSSDMHKLMLRRFEMQNKREYKGFLYEYRIMKEMDGNGQGAQYYIPPELHPVADRISKRWNNATDKMKENET